jgi:Skp family chaperone for outer membrane proteins
MDKLEERYVLEGLERHPYEKYTAKYKEEKHKLEEELQKAGKSISNLSAYTDKTLLIASQLGRLWQEGDFETREKLQYLIIPEGVQYERKNEAFRTQRINSVFLLIRSLPAGEGTKKEGQTIDFNSLSPRVG